MPNFSDAVNQNPLEPKLFLELVEIAHKALTGTLRVIPPDAERCLEKGGLFLSDIPENQMGMAVVRECRGRFPKEQAERIAQSYFMRWFALCRAKEEGLLRPFMKQLESGGSLINDAVFEAAATASLDAEGNFSATYVPQIRDIINQRGESTFE